jgi:hypothetical protein
MTSSALMPPPTCPSAPMPPPTCPAQPAGPESAVRRHKGQQLRDNRLRPIPVTVVGAGIGGLSVALSLLDAGAVGAEDITIVDASPGSGRLHTYTGRLGHACELDDLFQGVSDRRPLGSA